MYASKPRVTHARSDAESAAYTNAVYKRANTVYINPGLFNPSACGTLRSAVRRFHSIQRPRCCLLPTSNIDLQRRSISGVGRMETQQRIRQKGDSGRAGRSNWIASQIRKFSRGPRIDPSRACKRDRNECEITIKRGCITC